VPHAQWPKGELFAREKVEKMVEIKISKKPPSKVRLERRELVWFITHEMTVIYGFEAKTAARIDRLIGKREPTQLANTTLDEFTANNFGYIAPAVVRRIAMQHQVKEK
jgi:hypothetical protein